MLRALVFLAFALAPLVALAHGGHHQPTGEAPSARHSELGAVAAAASHCPGGGHEDCCCHDGWCTTTPTSIVLIDVPARELLLAGAEVRIALHSDPALPPAALLRFPSRGPPPLF